MLRKKNPRGINPEFWMMSEKHYSPGVLHAYFQITGAYCTVFRYQAHTPFMR
jgi:hypothetical protein